jgi:hypothetical protein
MTFRDGFMSVAAWVTAYDIAAQAGVIAGPHAVGRHWVSQDDNRQTFLNKVPKHLPTGVLHGVHGAKTTFVCSFRD